MARFCHAATSSSAGATNSYVANPQMPKSSDPWSIHTNLDIFDTCRQGHGQESVRINSVLLFELVCFRGKSVQGEAIGTDNTTVGALMHSFYKAHQTCCSSK